MKLHKYHHPRRYRTFASIGRLVLVTLCTIMWHRILQVPGACPRRQLMNNWGDMMVSEGDIGSGGESMRLGSGLATCQPSRISRRAFARLDAISYLACSWAPGPARRSCVKSCASRVGRTGNVVLLPALPHLRHVEGVAKLGREAASLATTQRKNGRT
jgi:hypothetical protein